MVPELDSLEDKLAALGLSRREAFGVFAAGVAAAGIAGPAAALQPAPLSATEIVRRAHVAAGGATWAKPRSLIMTGNAVFFPKGTQQEQVVSPDYKMWRTYPTASADAHAANGMVRIDAKRPDGSLYYQIAFDGVDTYNERGRIPGASASKEWSENFGFGIIRFALDEGFSLDLLPDDEADGRPIYTVRVNDPGGGKTLFGIAKDDFQILWLGFSTPKGWHERRYSHFYRNPGVSFTQPGRVRLFYDGVKQNEIWWTAYELNQAIPPQLFKLG
jgi:hypothetical protein